MGWLISVVIFLFIIYLGLKDNLRYEKQSCAYYRNQSDYYEKIYIPTPKKIQFESIKNYLMDKGIDVVLSKFGWILDCANRRWITPNNKYIEEYNIRIKSPNEMFRIFAYKMVEQEMTQEYLEEYFKAITMS